MRSWFRKRSRNNAGVAVVEAGIVTLGFLGLVLGVMEGGRFMSIQQTITDAAREGARLAVTPARQTFDLPSDAQIEERVALFLGSNGIPVEGPHSAKITIDRNVTVGGAPDTFTRVFVRYKYRVSTLEIFKKLKIDLRGTARMRNETSL